MIIDALIVKESLVGINLPQIQSGQNSRITLTSQQRLRLEFLLKKIRLFGENNRYHNAAYIENLLSAGEDRRSQFMPSPDCLAVVEGIIYPMEELSARDDDAPKPTSFPALQTKEQLAAD